MNHHYFANEYHISQSGMLFLILEFIFSGTLPGKFLADIFEQFIVKEVVVDFEKKLMALLKMLEQQKAFSYRIGPRLSFLYVIIRFLKFLLLFLVLPLLLAISYLKLSF